MESNTASPLRSLVFSTGFVSLRAGAGGNGTQVPYDRIVADLFDRYMKEPTETLRDARFAESVIIATKRLIGINPIKFFEDQLTYGRLDGMRILFLEDTIRSWINWCNQPNKGFETIHGRDLSQPQYALRNVSIEQWMTSVARTKLYSTPEHAETVKKLLGFLKDNGKGPASSTNELILSLLIHEDGLVDLVKTLFLMFGQEVVITHPTVRSAKNPGTQQLIDNLKQVV